MLTISENKKIEWEISKSKFIAYSFFVETETDIQNHINELWKQYPKATHICYGARLDNNYEKFDDNGEPSYTAGMPILDVIKKQNLNFLLIAVVRFYGGIKLGAGGLVRAYSKSATLVLDDAEKVKLSNYNIYKTKIDYENYAKLINMFDKNGSVRVLKNAFNELVQVDFAVREEESDSFIRLITREFMLSEVNLIKSQFFKD